MQLIVHSYYTDGMHEMAKVFVESFAQFHKYVPLIIDAVGINDKQASEIRERYHNMTVNVLPYQLDRWAEQCGVTVNTLLAWKEEIENGFVTPEARAWKLLTAGGDRVWRVYSLLNAVARYNTYWTGGTSVKTILHFDIDTLFRASVLPLKDFIEGYDMGLKLREKINPVKARITIDVMALNVTDNTLDFMSSWCGEITAVPIRERPIGFGQSSCWQAYCKADRLAVATLPICYGLPGRNKPTDAVWCGNVHNLKKEDCVGMFRKELNRLKSEKEQT